MLMVSFAVPGRPVPQGSLTSFRHRSTGQVVTPQKVAVREYRDRIAWAAKQTGMACTDEPVRVRAIFRFARPRSHYGTGRNHGQLKASAPRWCVGRPDLDKLARACLDALTGVIWCDDAQVVDLNANKYWTDEPSTYIEVVAVGDLKERVG